MDLTPNAGKPLRNCARILSSLVISFNLLTSAAAAALQPPAPPVTPMPPAKQAEGGQPEQSQAEQGQTERGQTMIAGRSVAYRIRRLPLSAFPEIPTPVRSTLEQLHCLVPQTYEARRPENVIHGHFFEKGSEDWAVLCSSDGTTSLEVIGEAAPGKHEELASHRDVDRLSPSKADGDEWGFNWGIDKASPARVREITGSASVAPDGDGIEDAVIDRSLTIHYMQGGWVTLERAQ